MLTFFRTNQLFSSVFLVFYILILRSSVFVAPFKWNPSGEGLLSHLVYGWIGSQTVTAQVIAILLLVVQGFLINSLVLSNRLSNEVNLFPGVFYVLVACLVPDFLYLSPVLIGNTFILVALVELYSTYKVSSCADRIFNAGFWTGVASLFYFPFLFYFILINAGLNILRAFNIKERLMLLIGLAIPFILGWLYYFVFDQGDFFWQTQFGDNFSFLSFGSEPGGWEAYAKSIVFALAILFVVANNGAYLTRRNIQAQKKISILYWVMISALIGTFFQDQLAFEHLIMLAPALGVFLAFTFTSMKSQWAESIHFLILILALVLQWVPWQL
ncbi:MAG: hypothetical protein AAFZ15_04015 [Bacteroidota bacterium]